MHDMRSIRIAFRRKVDFVGGIFKHRSLSVSVAPVDLVLVFALNFTALFI